MQQPSGDSGQRLASLWEMCLAFHGNRCRHLAIGLRASVVALERLGIENPGRNRLVCVSESDGCAVDAIQAVLGCTIGKKHLLFFNTGRLIFSVYDLERGLSVRICTRPEVTAPETALTIAQILEAPVEGLFTFEEARPMTQRVLAKVTTTCKHKQEEAPPRFGSIQDSTERFFEFDDRK